MDLEVGKYYINNKGINFILDVGSRIIQPINGNVLNQYIAILMNFNGIYDLILLEDSDLLTCQEYKGDKVMDNLNIQYHTNMSMEYDSMDNIETITTKHEVLNITFDQNNNISEYEDSEGNFWNDSMRWEFFSYSLFPRPILFSSYNPTLIIKNSSQLTYLQCTTNKFAFFKSKIG